MLFAESGGRFLVSASEFASLFRVAPVDRDVSGCPTHRPLVWLLLPGSFLVARTAEISASVDPSCRSKACQKRLSKQQKTQKTHRQNHADFSVRQGSTLGHESKPRMGTSENIYIYIYALL